LLGRSLDKVKADEIGHGAVASPETSVRVIPCAWRSDGSRRFTRRSTVINIGAIFQQTQL
jgi:hypothetical protein